MSEVFLSFTNLIKSYKRFIVMSHANVDLDGLSAGMCLRDIILSFGKEASLFFYNKTNNTSVNKAIKILKANKYPLLFLNDVKKLQNSKDTLLIIVDVHRQVLLEEPELINLFSNIAIIDHHMKSNDYIKDTVFSYINVNASSVVELMANYLDYLNKKADPLLATIMLAGLEIDTNRYKIKATEATYLAAASLAKMGADNIIKQELLQESKALYLLRINQLQTSYVFNKIYSICVLDKELSTREEIAILSDIQLNFEGVAASFTIGYIGDQTIGISARSLGRINVEKIMNIMGGGGHVTDAAAQIDDLDLLQTVKKLEEILD